MNYTGYTLELITAKGTQFKCSYAKKDLPRLLECVKNLANQQNDNYFILSINPGDAPPQPTTMEEWIRAGHTTD